jgi:hypothetical protein
VTGRFDHLLSVSCAAAQLHHLQIAGGIGDEPASTLYYSHSTGAGDVRRSDVAAWRSTGPRRHHRPGRVRCGHARTVGRPPSNRPTVIADQRSSDERQPFPSWASSAEVRSGRSARRKSAQGRSSTGAGQPNLRAGGITRL